MRIVSWNRQGRPYPPNKKFKSMLDEVGADVILIQETSAYPIADGWTFPIIEGAETQDKYAIGYKDGVKLVYWQRQQDPRADAKKLLRSYIVAQFEKDKEKVTVVTCHAPHAKGAKTTSSQETQDYMTALGGMLGSDVEIKSGGETKKAKSFADLFLGDTNLYELRDRDEWLPKGWHELLVGNTTGHKPEGAGGGAPLDRIAYRVGSLSEQQKSLPSFGRIMSHDSNGGSSKQDPGAQDLILSVEGESNPYLKRPSSAQPWTESDHLAIYADTSQVPVATSAPSTSQESKKRGRDEISGGSDGSPPPGKTTRSGKDYG